MNIAPHIAMRAMKVIAHRECRSHRPDEDVAVLDVAELVGEHAAQLGAVEHLEQTLGHGNDRVIRAAPGREGVRLRRGER